MELIKEIDEYLKNTLSESRYIHSIGVMNKAEELALIYGVDVNKAKICGLAHDIAKEMTEEESFEYIKENNIYIDSVEMINTKLLHGKIGADIAEKKFNFTKDMKQAIEYHTTTNRNMNMLDKIIFVADKIEDGRSNSYNIEYERELASKNLDEAMLYILDENIKHMIEKEKIIHPECIVTRNKILEEKLKIEDAS